MSVIVVVQQDTTNIHVGNVYIQNLFDYANNVTYERSVIISGGETRRLTIRVGPGEKVYVGRNCNFSTYTDLCGIQITTRIINVTRISRKQKDASSEEETVDEGINYSPPGAIEEPVEEREKQTLLNKIRTSYPSNDKSPVRAITLQGFFID